MSWRERDYHHSHPLFGERPRRRIEWPGPAALTLIGLHLAAAGAMLIARLDAGGGLAGSIGLFSGAIRPWAILTHPFAMADPFALALTVLAIWTLGDRIERRCGAARLVALYVAGNVVAGAAYAGYALLIPRGDALALTMPAGALAAWCAVGCFGLRDEFVTVLGKLRSVAQVAGVGGAIVLGVVLLFFGANSAAWIVAAVAGFGGGALVDRYAGSLRPGRFADPTSRVRRAGRRAAQRPQAAGGEDSGGTAPVAAGASAEIDAILAKISEGGMSSLSEAERRRLEEARQAMLKRR